jgi:hypothetical protein
MTRPLVLALSTVAIAAASATAEAACPAAPTSYSVTTLPGIPSGFGADETEGFDLNDDGDAVGSAFAVSSEIAWRAVRWPAGATAASGLSEGPGRAYGISEDGVVAGQGDRGGATWSALDVETLLPLPAGHGNAIGADVNAAGVVVGWASTSYDLHPYAWVDGTPIDLMDGVSDAASGLMRTINEAGVAVGEMAFYDAPYERAVRWSSTTGVVRILPGLIGYNGAEGDTTAMGINERGTVVGQSYLPLNETGEVAIIPVSWRLGTVTELALGRFAGGTAYDVNECGAIVGVGIVNASDYRAVIWQRGRVRDLNSMHGAGSLGLTAAVAINNEGQILVNGSGPIAYLLTPVP